MVTHANEAVVEVEAQQVGRDIRSEVGVQRIQRRIEHLLHLTEHDRLRIGACAMVEIHSQRGWADGTAGAHHQRDHHQAGHEHRHRRLRHPTSHRVQSATAAARIELQLKPSLA